MQTPTGGELVCGETSENKVILRASIIITKSLVALVDLADREGNTKVAHEVSMFNGALALLGNANHRNNLVRLFVM